jgi:hypothetical protein
MLRAGLLMRAIGFESELSINGTERNLLGYARGEKILAVTVVPSDSYPPRQFSCVPISSQTIRASNAPVRSICSTKMSVALTTLTQLDSSLPKRTAPQSFPYNQILSDIKTGGMRALIEAARRHQGTGLGLALTNIIFQERGVGSRFDISTIFVS